MKHLLVSSFAVFAAVAALSAAAGPSAPLRILPLGDSITYGSHGQDTAGYRGPLYQMLTNAHYRIDYVGTDGGTQGSVIRLPDSDHEHEGHSGWGTANIPTVSRPGVYDALPNCFSRILAPNIVLLHIGTNDAEDPASMPDIVSRYRKILDRITTMQPSAHVIITSPLRRVQERQEKLLSTYLLPYVKGLADEYAAKGKRVHFLDMRSVVGLEDLDDGLHPTCAGYAKMAKAWFGAIRKIVPNPDAYDDPQPTVLSCAYDDLVPNRVTLRFNETMSERDVADLANYVLTGDAAAKVVSATLSKDRRSLVLDLKGVAFGKVYTLAVRNLRNAPETVAMVPFARELKPIDPASLRRGARANVPEAAGYRLVYGIDLPASDANYGNNLPKYDVDQAAGVGAFSRVAYYLELRRPGEPLRYVWASFDAPTNDVTKLAIPAGPTEASFQTYVSNLVYRSNHPGVGDGRSPRGFIEFFKGQYNERNVLNVPGARHDRYDWGDNITNPDGLYGSMQVHDVDRGLTLFAYNRWRGGDQDLGIGNRTDFGHTDWTTAQNSATYDIRRLEVYVDGSAYEIVADHPADVWTEAHPVGNGRLGAMVNGGVEKEILQINEDTLWLGGPGQNRDKRVTAEHFDKVRELALAERFDEMKAALPVDTTSSCSYQLFGSVELDFGPGEATEYVRTLSMDDAISRVSYVRDGVRYTREVFASLADDVVICHLTASRKGALSFKARILEPWKGETKAFGNRIVHRNATGSCRNKKGGQVRFEGILAAKNDWGRVQAADDALIVSNADSLTLYLSVGSNFNRYDDLSGDPHARAETRLDAAWKRPYAEARADHVRRCHRRIAESSVLLHFLDHLLVFLAGLHGVYANRDDLNTAQILPLRGQNFI